MTYSIAVVDRGSGAAGVAAVTAVMAVGAFVPAVRAGVGAIATQGASTNWLYGELGLHALADGTDAAGTLRKLTAADRGRDYRQCIIVDRRGDAATWTGDDCEIARADTSRTWVAAAGNNLSVGEVVESMIDAYESSTHAELAERLLAALDAGQAAGGDSRGIMSAVLIIDFPDRPPVDVRVDYAPDEALVSLRDLYSHYTDLPFRDFYERVPTRADFSRCRR